MLSKYSDVEHIRKGKGNEKFFAELKNRKMGYNDWMIVIIFYTALHYVDAFCFKDNKTRPSDHNNRRRRIENSVNEILGDYEGLLQCSKIARYDCCEIQPTLIDHCEQRLTDIKKILKTKGVLI